MRWRRLQPSIEHKNDRSVASNKGERSDCSDAGQYVRYHTYQNVLQYATEIKPLEAGRPVFRTDLRVAPSILRPYISFVFTRVGSALCISIQPIASLLLTFFTLFSQCRIRRNGAHLCNNTKGTAQQRICGHRLIGCVDYGRKRREGETEGYKRSARHQAVVLTLSEGIESS